MRNPISVSMPTHTFARSIVYKSITQAKVNVKRDTEREKENMLYNIDRRCRWLLVTVVVVAVSFSNFARSQPTTNDKLSEQQD